MIPRLFFPVKQNSEKIVVFCQKTAFGTVAPGAVSVGRTKIYRKAGFAALPPSNSAQNRGF
jgi:hypothetical protein